MLELRKFMKINWSLAKRLLVGAERKKFELTAVSPQKSLPLELQSLINSKSGLYKLDPSERLVDVLKEVTVDGNIPKFPEAAIRRKIQNVNTRGAMCCLNRDLYVENRCRKIADFAKRNDVELSDVAEFVQMPDYAFDFVKSLPSDRFKIFKEFMRYTQGDQFHIKSIGNTDLRRFSFNDLEYIASKMPEENLDKLRKLINIKRPQIPFGYKGEYVFTGEDMLKIANTKGLDIDSIVNLAQTSGLNGFSICEIAKTEGVNLSKVQKAIAEIRKTHNGNVVLFAQRDKYNPKMFSLQEWSKTNDKEVLIKTFDQNAQLVSTDRILPVPGKQNQARIIGNDFDVVIGAQGVPTNKNDSGIENKFISVISETRKIKDVDGNLLRTEVLTPSEVPGLHNWKAVMPDGTVKSLIDVKRKNGILTVTKNFDSLDGTTTKSKYKKLSDGSWAMRLNISKDNKILAKRNIKHKMISSNEAESVINGQKYRIKYSADEITVLDSKGKTNCIINLKELVDSCNTPDNAAKLKKMLKECSADELQIISKKLKRLEFNNIATDSFANCEDGIVSCSDDIFIFRHEMGHIDDLFGTGDIGRLSSSDKFRQVYQQEYDMFMNGFSNTQKDYVDYFIERINVNRPNQPYEETVAELLASNKCPGISTLLSTRTEYLERYFPKTRSFLVNA